MRGVDWRQKIVNSVENFIDCSSMSLDDIAELIKEYGIQINYFHHRKFFLQHFIH